MFSSFLFSSQHMLVMGKKTIVAILWTLGATRREMITMQDKNDANLLKENVKRNTAENDHWNYSFKLQVALPLTLEEKDSIWAL